MIDRWNDQFRQTLGQFERSLVGELLEHRNRHAHDETFTSDDTLRALDSIQRLLVAVSCAKQAREVDEVKVELQRTVFAEQARQKTRQVSSIEIKTEAGLKPWRDIVQPHPVQGCARSQVYRGCRSLAQLRQVVRPRTKSGLYHHTGRADGRDPA